MGYKVKWIVEHLGITRKALLVYEDKGLMPKNEDGKDRNYSDEDVDRIWEIKVLQGMGYSLAEISNIANLDKNTEFDFIESITQKIKKLESDKAKIEQSIGYAKMIQLTGRFPARPKEMGSIKIQEFQEKSKEAWNVLHHPEMESTQNYLTQLLNQPIETWGETELGTVLNMLVDLGTHQAEIEESMAVHTLQKAIIARSDQGTSSPEVQLLVKILYEQIQAINESWTPQQFGRLYSSGFMEGQLSQLNQQTYGIEGCAFLADAIAIFGGYLNYEDSM